MTTRPQNPPLFRPAWRQSSRTRAVPLLCICDPVPAPLPPWPQSSSCSGLSCSPVDVKLRICALFPLYLVWPLPYILGISLGHLLKDAFGGSDGKESACNCKRPGFNSWVGKIPWEREWYPTPVSLLGEFQGQRSLVGYSPWGCKESDTTEQLTLHFFTISIKLSLLKYNTWCVHAKLFQSCLTLHLPFPSPGDLPDPGIKLVSLVSCIGRWVLYH